MTDQQTRQLGDFCWVELCTPDMEKAKKFYNTVLNWEYDSMPMSETATYTLMKVQDAPIAGGYELTAEFEAQGMKPSWGSYILVDDVDESTKRARALGATVYREPFDVFEMGRMSVLADPTGAVFYLWQAKGDPQSMPANNKTPGNFGWHELATTDTKKAAQFYCDLLGWESESQEVQPGKIYTTFTNNGAQVAGMLEITDDWIGVPPHWTVYFNVSDLDRAINDATKLSGTLLYDPIEVPEVGRFTKIRDPQGAHFSLIQFSGA